MIKEIIFNKDYLGRSDYADAVFIEFVQKDDYTYMNITTVQKGNENTYTKEYLLTKEDYIDKEDIRNVNEILKEQDIEIINTEIDEENEEWE